MGCSTSTPLANAGNEMLKAASHVAADATKSAENAVEDVTQALGKTIETAKENVGTAVTGIAHEVSSTIQEKADETKAILLDKLHLNNSHDNDRSEQKDAEADADMLMKRNAAATLHLARQHAMDKIGDIHDGHHGMVDDSSVDGDIVQRHSRGPTPVPVQQLDSDSLKTTTSEPEIERALANKNGSRNSPATPKPNISELERLSAELNDLRTDTLASDASILSPMVSTVNQSMSDVSSAAAHIQAEETGFDQTPQRRPNTTEWEKYADGLAKNKKFHPNEIVLRRRLVGPHTTAALPTTLGATAENGVSEASAVASHSVATMPPTLTTMHSKSSINVPQYFRDFPRSTTDINRFQGDVESGYSDRNNGSTSSPDPANRFNTKLQRKRITRNTMTPSNVKKIHRQLTSLIGYGYGSDRNALPAKAVLPGRHFDFNPNRMRVGSPITPIVRKRNNYQSLLPIRLKDPPRLTNRFGSRIGSPVKVAPIKQLSRPAFSKLPTTQTLSTTPSSSPSRIGLYSFDQINSATTSARTLSQPPSSSRSSTNNSLVEAVIKSNCTSPPISCSPSKNSLALEPDIDVVPLSNMPIITPHNQQVPCPLRSLSATPSPELVFLDDCCLGARRKMSLGPMYSPKITKNTSSFLSSPRTSPFCNRKSYSDCEDKENKAEFVADLSSAAENRQLLAPSPYKIRERCAVCYNKYIVK